MGASRQVDENRRQGRYFEELFFKQAQKLGLLALPSYLACKMSYAGQLMLIPGDLDFKLVQERVTGFFDCKCFDADHFNYSALDQHQIERATLYNERKVPSGFVVLLKKTKNVYFYSGQSISKRGQGSMFSPADGVLLGPWYEFDLRLALA